MHSQNAFSKAHHLTSQVRQQIALDHIDLDHRGGLGNRLRGSLFGSVELIEENLCDSNEAVGEEFHLFHQVIDLLLLLRIVANL